ncbi:cell envelope integrity protein CreD [Novosphingobium sp. ZN18A2]|uniref:cell envelope integrity protein CreD n=1 Tax=Novosphingobium sp. ZN18A2 TaxID=3079861 RepID=UPI0030CB84C2
MDNGVTRRERSPGMKLLFVAIVAAVLIVPLMLVYALVYDRQDQAQTAQQAINAGWGGQQVLSGPIVAIPYKTTQLQRESVDGKTVERAVEVEKTLYLSPVENRAETRIDPQERKKSIYRSVLYTARVSGHASFAVPADLARFGIKPAQILWDRAELRIGVSDARGLTTGGFVKASGKPLEVQPGNGPAASGGQGFFAFVPWDGQGTLPVEYAYSVRGSRAIGLVPRGGSTRWDVTSAWPSPSFGGSFLPEKPRISGKGFTASYTVDKLALGQPPVANEDMAPPQIDNLDGSSGSYIAMARADRGGSGQSLAVTVGLVEPVNLYSKVNRAVKYGFLFIGFTFLAFLLFDVVGGARVASAEYLLTGAGLILFFVLLLAFAEVIGFTAAYLLASAAIIGLLTAYSAAVLGSWKRARFIGALLVGLYALLFVLLNLAAWSLLIGSVLLFAALAGVMYATRKVDWGAVGRHDATA